MRHKLGQTPPENENDYTLIIAATAKGFWNCPTFSWQR